MCDPICTMRILTQRKPKSPHIETVLILHWEGLPDGTARVMPRAFLVMWAQDVIKEKRVEECEFLHVVVRDALEQSLVA